MHHILIDLKPCLLGVSKSTFNTLLFSCDFAYQGLIKRPYIYFFNLSIIFFPRVHLQVDLAMGSPGFLGMLQTIWIYLKDLGLFVQS